MIEIEILDIRSGAGSTDISKHRIGFGDGKESSSFHQYPDAVHQKSDK